MFNKSHLEKPPTKENITGLKSTDSPAFVTVKLSGLTDGKIPYHVNDSTGLADGPTKTDVDDAISLKHAAGSDNQDLSGLVTKAATSPDPTGYLPEYDATGNLIKSSKLSSSVHDALTIDGTSPLSLSGQAISLKNDAAAAITEVDTGALDNSTTKIPTNKTVYDAIAGVTGMTHQQILARSLMG